MPRFGWVQTQKLALEELKGDADRTRKQAEVHGTFLVQRMHSHSGLNTVEQLPSDYLWELVESFERRFTKYVQVGDSPVVLAAGCVVPGPVGCGGRWIRAIDVGWDWRRGSAERMITSSVYECTCEVNIVRHRWRVYGRRRFNEVVIDILVLGSF